MQAAKITRVQTRSGRACLYVDSDSMLTMGTGAQDRPVPGPEPIAYAESEVRWGSRLIRRVASGPVSFRRCRKEATPASRTG